MRTCFVNLSLALVEGSPAVANGMKLQERVFTNRRGPADP